LQKGWILCQEVMVQGLPARGPARAGVWAEAKAKAGAGWAGHLPQGRAVIAYAQAVEQRLLTLQDSLAIKEAVLSVEQK
jgi:hypothetical protein